MNNWLFGYGGKSLESPEGYVQVPEGMSVAQFLDRIDGLLLKQFVAAVQDSNEAASQGNIPATGECLDLIVNLNQRLAEQPGTLRGLEAHNAHMMRTALANYLQQGNQITSELKQQVQKYI